MASSSESHNAAYPDPQPNLLNTPYASYQPARPEQRRDGGGSGGQNGGDQGHGADSQRDIPDDPALRSHLAGMMSNFQGFAAFPNESGQQQDEHSGPNGPAGDFGGEYSF